MRVEHPKDLKERAIKIARIHGSAHAAKVTGVAMRTIRTWVRLEKAAAKAAEKSVVAPKSSGCDLPKLAEPRDNSVKMRWRGEKFRLIKDHSLLRYFIVRREDVPTMPKFCTVEHLFPDGRHAIHDCELVVSARALRFHPSYLARLANVHLCELRSAFARGLMLESGLLRPGDDRQLVDLVLAMVERDRRRDAMWGGGNDD